MKTRASWSASIAIYSEANGLVVELSGDAKPEFADVESEGTCSLDMQELHKMHLPRIINMEPILTELKAVWEGAWQWSSLGCLSYTLANPVFNRHGDLLVQLGLFGARQTVYGTPRKRRSGIPPKLSLRKCSPSGVECYILT